MDKETADIKEGKKRKWWHWPIRAIIFILCLLILLSLLLQLKSVQNYVGNYVTSSISKRIDEKVTIGNVKLSISKGLELDDLLIVDNRLDTLVLLKDVNVTLQENLFSLVRNDLSISDINIDGAYINATINEQGENNVNRLLNNLFFTGSPDNATKKTQTPFNVNAKSIDLRNAFFNLDDKLKGNNLNASVDQIKIEINDLNLPNKTFDIESIILTKPTIDFAHYMEKLVRNTAEQVEVELDETKKTNALSFILGSLVINDGRVASSDILKYSNLRKHFDPSNFDINELNLELLDINYKEGVGAYSSLKNLSFEEQSGFKLKSFYADSIKFKDGVIDLDDFSIKTANSTLSQNLSIDLAESGRLKSSYINADLRNSVVSIKDLNYFIKDFDQRKFYKENGKLDFVISGKYRGTIDNIRGSQVNIRAGNVLALRGDFGIRNISKPETALLNLSLEQLNADINKVSDLFGGIELPPNFEKLGNITFSGNFDGYYNDFVAFGDLKSEIGAANLDMRLDTKNGADNAIYSGNINLMDFDLGTWADSEDLGLVNFNARIRNGLGLTSKNAYADLSGVLETFMYKGYTYANITLDGKIDENNFKGSVLSQDPNLDFSFQGEVSKEEDNFVYDFKAEVGQIDFYKLNLDKNPLLFKGFVELKGEGKSVNDFLGRMDASEIYLLKKDSIYQFDSLSVVAEPSDQFGKKIDVSAPGIEVSLNGLYNVNTVISDVKSIIKYNYPYHTRNWNVSHKEITDDQNFRFEIDTDQGQVLLDILEINNVNLTNIKAKGTIVSSEEEINVVSHFPSLVLNKQRLYNLNLAVNSIKDQGEMRLRVDSSFLSSRLLKGVSIQTSIDRDNINFVVDASGVLDSFQKVYLQGHLEPEREGYKIRILNNDLNFYDQRWKINADNEIVIASDFISIRNASITDGTKLFELKDIDNKGLLLQLDNIDVALINQFHNARKFTFGGSLGSTIRVKDIFVKSPDVYGEVNIEDFSINEDNYGIMSFDITKPLNSPLEAQFSLENEENGQAIKATMAYNLETKEVGSKVKGKNFPLKFLEYIMKDGVSGVEGTADFNALITGNIKDLKVDGYAQFSGGKVKVNYLGETYYFDDQSARITHDIIDLTGGVMYDSQGNSAVVTGGLRHHLFRGFYLFANITGENIIALNTTKEDNPAYYGLGKGFVSVDFSGAINAVNMAINAETKAGSNLSIPIVESQTSADKSFITFINQEEYFSEENQKLETRIRLDGISIDMNLTMTPEAKVNLIFDESKGDIIRATGRGNMQILMSRYGDFEIFGDYEIEQGEYLFTAWGFVAKPFIVRRGGKVNWTGDPINAAISIEADYLVRTSVNNFIPEYLTTDYLKGQAAARTSVNLKMILGNTLFNPSINFDMEFPELTGELRTYADSKLRLLSNNEADFNSQVFGLIVFKTFLPSSAVSVIGANSGALESAGMSTLSEFVSSQVSLFVTSLINQALEDNGLISGIDFNLDLRNNSSLSFDADDPGSSTFLPAEIEVRMNSRFRFLDERLSFGIGGNFVRENIGGLQNFIIPDFTLQYALTADGKINLKMYGKYDVDIGLSNNRRQKYGIGLRYRTEFGSMLETKNNLSDFLKDEIVETQ